MKGMEGYMHAQRVPETSRLSAEFAFLTRLHEFLADLFLLHILVGRDREASRNKVDQSVSW